MSVKRKIKYKNHTIVIRTITGNERSSSFTLKSEILDLKAPGTDEIIGHKWVEWADMHSIITFLHTVNSQSSIEVLDF